MSALTASMQQKRSTTMDQSYRPNSQFSAHQKRPSIQTTMHWLSRSPTPGPGSAVPSAGSSTGSKSSKVQEPKPVRTIDMISSPPKSAGLLGSGATIVRTPDEALRETGVRVARGGSPSATSPPSPQRSAERKEEKTPRPKHKRAPSKQLLLSPPTSPPLPPLPMPEEDEERLLEGETVPMTPSHLVRPLPGTSFTPDAQRTVSLRSSMKTPKAISVINSTSTYEELPEVPPLPPHIAASTQPPPFSPILVSEPPSPLADQSKLIVTLETCTQTFRTTLATLNSRPSHLSKYIATLYNSNSNESSVYSTESDDMNMYRRHLTAQGLVPVSTNVHIFLDRPSSPYHHILTYLRTPPIEGQHETLPYALQLRSSFSSSTSSSSTTLNSNSSSTLLPLPGSSPSTSHHPSSPHHTHAFAHAAHLEALIEVRDEAAYLHLEALHKLCADEIRHRYGPRLSNNAHHTRGQSTSSLASVHSLHASMYGLGTLVEKGESEDRHSVVIEKDGPGTPSTAVLYTNHGAPSAPTPPTNGHTRSPTNNSTNTSLPGPFAPPPAAIAIRRSRQLLKDLSTPSYSNSNSTSTSSVDAGLGIPRTPPTPKSWEGHSAPNSNASNHADTTPTLARTATKSSSRSSSKTRHGHAGPPPAGWI